MLKFTRTALTQSVLQFARNDSGATAIEYALIASGVAVAIAATLINVGTSVKNLFTNVSSALK